MTKIIETIIENKGELVGAREAFLKNVAQFPTYDLLVKDYIDRNPQLTEKQSPRD